MGVGDATADVVAVLEVLEEAVEDPGPEVRVEGEPAEVDEFDEDGPEDTLPLPGSPVMDGATFNVAVGNMVVVTTVVVIMVVGPLMYIILPSP